MIGYTFAGRLKDATGREWTVAVKCTGHIDRAALPVLLTAHGHEEIEAALRVPGQTVLQDGQLYSVSSALHLRSTPAVDAWRDADPAFFEKVRVLALARWDRYVTEAQRRFDELEAERRARDGDEY